MRNIDNLKKIAILIDADNARISKLKFVLEEISTHGHIITKRAYGDWSNDSLKNWKSTLNELAIHPVQQFAYTSGKNSTDSAMIIDAMDLLYTQKYDAFALVSSDSDFTKLSTRLKESEIFVFGVGENKTPIAFRNACDDFILTENLGIEEEVVKDNKTTKKQENEKIDMRLKEVITLLEKAHKKNQDERGWVDVSAAGSYIKRVKPDFDVRTYGESKFTDLIKRLNSNFETNKSKGKGTSYIIKFRPINRK